MNAESEALIEQYNDLPWVTKFLCAQCGSFYITFNNSTPGVEWVQNKRLCSTCSEGVYYKEKRVPFPRNPYNIKNWIDADVKLDLFKCYGCCKHDVNKLHELSENLHGAIGVRHYVFRKDISICEICFLDFTAGHQDKKNLENAAIAKDRTWC